MAWDVAGSEILAQVHARVQLPDLRFVAIEHQRFDFLRQNAAVAYAPLAGLAPTRVVNIRIGARPASGA